MLRFWMVSWSNRLSILPDQGRIEVGKLSGAHFADIDYLKSPHGNKITCLVSTIILDVIVVVVILFPTEYKQCITAYMNNNIKNKTT